MQLSLTPFAPHPAIRSGHLQTIFGYYLPAPIDVGPPRWHQITLPDGDRLSLGENRPRSHPSFQRTALLMHGLGGHADAPYMLRLATRFRQRGWLTLRLNHRGCGEGRGLARQLYHSGRSEDLHRVLEQIHIWHPEADLVVVGFSLSGNLLLKYLGEDRHPISEQLRGALAINPPIDLALCASALHRRRNRIYELRFARLLKQAIHERREDFPNFPAMRLPRFMSVREFDELCTAPMNGFESASDYYQKCSAKQFMGGITTPTVLMASDDDPFVPAETYADLPFNSHLQMVITRGGGHMGFISKYKTAMGNRRWMDYAVVTLAEALLQRRTLDMPGVEHPAQRTT